ncbi:MAG: uroporphyrinogen-III synthase [Rhodobacterales bacterium]|nr:uroporphyrinogen-III synthase [Rhodobacterales bacterium]
MAKQPKALTGAQPAVPVLISRPLAEGQAFAASLSLRLGDRVRALVSPLMAVEYLSPDLPAGPFAAVIFTSAAGVAAAERLQSDLPSRAFCVGAKTAEQARSAGFSAVSADGDADALTELVLAANPGGRLLHLRGMDTRGEVAEKLNSAGIETESRVVYRQTAQPLAPEARALLQNDGPVVVPLFSPRSARLFADAFPEDARAGLYLVAMSPAVADVAAALPHRALVVALRPDAKAMLDAVAKVLDGPLMP